MSKIENIFIDKGLDGVKDYYSEIIYKIVIGFIVFLILLS